MNVIGTKIKYLPATDEPLSADVYYITGDKYCYIYDVGNSEISLQHINQTVKEKVVILSHYHKDHTGNIDEIQYHNLYVGKKTQEVIGKGTVIVDTLTIHDGVKIDVIPCPSPHTEGSLIVTVDNEYTLIADLYFQRPPFDKENAAKMLESLNNVNTKYFVVSHQKSDKIIPKAKLIAELTDYFHETP